MEQNPWKLRFKHTFILKNRTLNFKSAQCDMNIVRNLLRHSLSRIKCNFAWFGLNKRRFIDENWMKTKNRTCILFSSKTNVTHTYIVCTLEIYNYDLLICIIHDGVHNSFKMLINYKNLFFSCGYSFEIDSVIITQ